MRIAAVTVSRDQGPFLLEWIAHHRALGVAGFVVYWHETGDGTAALLAALAREEWLLALPAPDEPLRDARGRPETRGADFTMFLQPDEFLNISTGDGTVAALVDACDAPDLISVSAQVFGWCGVTGYDDRPTLATFTRTHNPDLCGDSLSLPVRTLFRSALPLLATHPARPFLRVRRLNRGDLPAPRWTDGSGREVPRGFSLAAPDKPVDTLPARGARLHATLNCYPIRSLATHIARTARLDGGALAPGFDDGPWRACADDGYAETSILRHLPATLAQVDALRRLPGVAEAQDAAVALHRQAIARVEAASGHAELAARLAGLPRRPPAELAIMKLLELA
jgi:hypothetical protein